MIAVSAWWPQVSPELPKECDAVEYSGPSCFSVSSGRVFSKLPMRNDCPEIPKKGENGSFTPKIYAHELCAS